MSGTKYKIKLLSGRILGPLDLQVIMGLIDRGHIKGNEPARLHPHGEWKGVSTFPEISELLLLKLEGKLGLKRLEAPRPSAELEQEIQTLFLNTADDKIVDQDEIVVELTGSKTLQEDEAATIIGENDKLNIPKSSLAVNPDDFKTGKVEFETPNYNLQFDPPPKQEFANEAPRVPRVSSSRIVAHGEADGDGTRISEKKTQILDTGRLPGSRRVLGARIPSAREILTILFLGAGLTWLTFDMFFTEAPKSQSKSAPKVRAFILLLSLNKSCCTACG